MLSHLRATLTSAPFRQNSTISVFKTPFSTKIPCYNALMNILSVFSLTSYLPHCFLSVTAISGFGLVVFLFLFCFLSVHIFVLIKLGWESRTTLQQPSSTPPPEEKKTPEPKQTEREPIYYIVERKRTRPKKAYSEPKEFRFK